MGLRRRIGRALSALAGREPPRPAPPPLAYGQLLEGRRALVTGSGRNIGKAIAFELARQGAQIVLHDRDARALASALEEAVALGFHTTAVHADVTIPADVDRLAAEVRRTGGCDLLVNNVGFTIPHDHPSPLSDDLWRHTFDTNLAGPVRLTRLVTEDLIGRASPGVVIFVSSMHARITYGAPAYSSSKAAVEMLIAELAVALAPHRIRVNGVAPGFVASDAVGGSLPHDLGLLYRSSIPAAFIGRAVMMLASETLSAWTTGSILTVDAGVSQLSYLTAAEGRRRG